LVQVCDGLERAHILSAMDGLVSDCVARLRGRRVGRICVDHEYTLGLLSLAVAEQPEYVWLEMGGRFVYRPPDAAEHLLGLQDDPVHFGPALALFGDTVSEASVSAAGELTVRFESGAELMVPTDPNYEAWRLNAPGVPTIVSPPGGGQPVTPVREYRGT
jgi:hypothetical protein